jgi:type IV pilus assembly protein PilF
MNMPTHNIFNPGRTLLAAIGQLLALLAVVILVSGCASRQSTDPDGKSESRRAAESNTALGLEYMNRGQYEVALGKLKKAVRDDPDYAPAHTVTAVLYERIGEMELAGKHYRKAYEADPTDGDVNNNYGVYLCQTEKADRAMGHFLKALDDPFYSSPAIALTNAGSCSLGRDKLTEANDYLRAALKIEPEFPDALLAMAQLNYIEKNALKSRAFMQRYEAVANHGAASLLLAYKIEMASRDNKAAKKYLLILEASFPKSDQAAEARRISGK